MNMSAYQEFMRTFAFITSRNPENHSLPLSTMREKLALYEQMGAESAEDRERLFNFRTSTMIEYINTGLSVAKFFEVDKFEKRLMLLTDCPKSGKILKFVKMPFQSIFLDIDIDASELPDSVLREGIESIHGILLMQINVTNDRMDRVISRGESHPSDSKIFYCAYSVDAVNHDGQRINAIYDCMIPVEDNEKEHIMFDKQGKKQLSFFRNFVINLLLFIEHPDVELLHFERTKKSQERRIREHKMVLPSSHRIRLSGRLKRYVYDMRSSLGGGFDFRFWVRGFWRVHRSDRFVNMRGKIIWIEPFLKGKGDLRESTYSVEADKDNQKDYSDKFLFLDDIQPLDKPLNELLADERLKRAIKYRKGDSNG